MENVNKYTDVFSIPVKGANGEPMYLEQFRGKILVFVNTTGHCGNARQWPILDNIQKEYADKNVQIVYLPTNDYCGSVTFGEYKDGIKNGQESADYAKKTFGIEAPFTELVSSRNEPWEFKVAKLEPDGDGTTKKWIMNPEAAQTLTQAPRSDLYNFLLNDSENSWLGGNFHKIFTNKAGQPVIQLANDALNDFPEWEKGRIAWTQERELAQIKRVIDELIATDTYTHENLSDAWMLIT